MPQIDIVDPNLCLISVVDNAAEKAFRLTLATDSTSSHTILGSAVSKSLRLSLLDFRPCVVRYRSPDWFFLELIIQRFPDNSHILEARSSSDEVNQLSVSKYSVLSARQCPASRRAFD